MCRDADLPPFCGGWGGERHKKACTRLYPGFLAYCAETAGRIKRGVNTPLFYMPEKAPPLLPLA